MKLLPLAMLVLCLAACTSSQKNTDADTVTKLDTAKKDTAKPIGEAPVIESFTFLHKEGKDSTRVEFTLINDRLQGLMDWFPSGKEGHSGIIEGTLKNDTIHAVWGYAIGRQTDTMKVEFLFKAPKSLRQKPLITNAKTNRLQTNDKAGFTLLYKPSNRNHR